MTWWRNFWIATDVWVSNMIWADPNITISSKTAEARASGKLWGKIGCRILNFLFRSPDHCAKALAGDLTRAKQAENELTPYVDKSE